MTDRLQGLVLTPEGLKPGYLAGPVGGGEKGRGGRRDGKYKRGEGGRFGSQHGYG